MFGDDPSKEVPKEERKHAFLHKPVPAKILIALAGPLMNLILAAFLFSFLTLLGQPFPAATLGDISPNSTAYEAGFRSGDQIQKIQKKEIKTWNEAQHLIRKSKGNPLEFQVKREGEEKILSFFASPKNIQNKDISSFKRNVGEIEGVTPFSLMPILGLNSLKKDSLAVQAGFRNFDRILSVNEKDILYFRELKRELNKVSSSNSTLTFKVKNETPKSLKSLFPPPAFKEKDKNQTDKIEEERLLTLELPPSFFKEKADNPSLSLNSLGLVSMELVLASVVKNSPAEKAGLKAGDRIVSINDKSLSRWMELSNAIQTYNPETKIPLSLRVLRKQEELSYEVTPEYKSVLEKKVTYASQEKKYILGITHIDIRTLALPVLIKETNWIKAFLYGWEESFHTSVMIVANILALIQNKISPRNIAGVITIGRYANRYFEAGIIAFLKLMALFSINLFLINLLPIPILDGGHIFFFTLEGLRGKPLSLKKMELAQQIGFSILLLLMGFALFNDI